MPLLAQRPRGVQVVDTSNRSSPGNYRPLINNARKSTTVLSKTTPERTSRASSRFSTPSASTPGSSSSRLGKRLDFGSGRSSLRPGDHVPANGGYKHDKIIFLDVDGVLHSIFARNESQLFRRDCMQRLKKIVDQTGARIVLSSSWRKSAAGKNAVNQQLQSHGIPLPFDNTRIRWDEYKRHEDISHWIQQNPSRNWVAIDDLPMHQLGEHFLGTNHETGLNDRDVQRAVQLLNRGDK